MEVITKSHSKELGVEWRVRATPVAKLVKLMPTSATKFLMSIEMSDGLAMPRLTCIVLHKYK
jgi:hypothetical protein